MKNVKPGVEESVPGFVVSVGTNLKWEKRDLHTV